MRRPAGLRVDAIRACKSYGKGSGGDHLVTGEGAGRIDPDLCLVFFLCFRLSGKLEAENEDDGVVDRAVQSSP